MGWSATLTSNKNITHEEVETIVSNLPELLMLGGGTIKPVFCGWGWSAAADIDNPHGNTLNIGGSYRMSGGVAKTMAEYLKEHLEENGHEITIEYDW